MLTGAVMAYCYLLVTNGSETHGIHPHLHGLWIISTDVVRPKAWLPDLVEVS